LELKLQQEAEGVDGVDDDGSIGGSVGAKSVTGTSVTSSLQEESSYATSVTMSQQESGATSANASITGPDREDGTAVPAVVVEVEKYAAVLDKSPFDMLSAYQNDQVLNKCIDIINEMVELRDKSEYQAAMNCYLSLEKEIKNCRVYHEKNVLHAFMQSQLGCLYGDQDMHPEAQKCFEVVIGILYHVYGDDCIHPYISSSLLNIAGSLKSQYKYNEALDKYLEAHDMLLKLYRQAKGMMSEDEDTDEIAACLHAISQCYLGVKNFEKGMSYCEEAYEMRCRVNGPDHPDTTSVLNTIGIILIAENRIDEAEEIFEKILKMREKVCGQKHQAYGTLANNVAMANYVYFDLAKAGRSLSYSLDIKQNHIGPYSLDYLTTLRNFMAIFRLQSDKEYLPFVENAQQILKEALNKST
jgi:tetratricopeptide (TPR) repeat protein